MPLTRGIEDFCKERATNAAKAINKWLVSLGVIQEQSVLVLYLGTGWKVFNKFKGCERLQLKDIDPEFGCLPEVEDHPNELVYVPDLAGTGAAALVLNGRPHLYQKWFKKIGEDHLVETSAKYLVRLHTEMMLYLGLMRPGRVGPFIITSATGTLSKGEAPVGSIMVVKGYNSLELDLPIQRFTVARGALCHDLQEMALSCGEGIEVCLKGKKEQPLAVQAGGLKVILGPGFEDPQFEQLFESDCQAVGMSGATAGHVIRGFNVDMVLREEPLPEKVTRAVHLCLVTDDPYEPELIEVSPFAEDSPWKPKHKGVLNLAKKMENETRQFFVNLVQGIRSDGRFD